MHPDDLPLLMEKWQASVAAGLSHEIEGRLGRYDGVYRWFLIRAEPFRDETGTIVRWYGTSTDIDDRKLAEEALRASETNLRQIIDSIPGLVCTMDATGEIEQLNSPLLEYFGKTSEELKSGKITNVVHPEDLPQVVKAFTYSVTTGTPYDIEHRCRRADGVYRWFQILALPVRDVDGPITGWYVLLTDIDDRKRTEEELHRKEAFLLKAQRLSATGSFSGCIETDEITFSEEAYRIFEFAPRAPMNFGMIASRVHPDDLELLGERRDAARSTSEGHDYEIRLRMPDGSLKYLHTTSNKMSNVNGLREYIGAIQDVTQRRVAQEALIRRGQTLPTCRELCR